MRRRRKVPVLLAGAAAVWGAGPLAVHGPASGWAVAAARGPVPAAAAVSWGRSIAVPGLRALNKGDSARVIVSCASAGDCAAGGYYRVRGAGANISDRGFVADERNGRWGKAIRVPGLATLSSGQQSSVDSVSCGSAGSCAAGGDYWNHGHQGFVTTEKNGRWHRAVKTAGPVSSVSCRSAGNCAAGGTYRAGGARRGFVVVEKNGIWGRGIEVPGLAALNAGGNAAVSSVSCASAGNCAAGGTYRDGSGGQQGFVAARRNRAWGQAIEVPGLAALNAGGNAWVSSVSCASAANCTAGGGYTNPDFPGCECSVVLGFVVSEKNGAWGQAIELPGLDALNTGTDDPGTPVSLVSCASAGNCATGGTMGRIYTWGFLASEKNGVWGQAFPLSSPILQQARYLDLSSLSCAPAGSCAAGGGYFDVNTGQHEFVATEQNGRWDGPTRLPGLAALGGNGDVDSVSCTSAGHCTAGGTYRNGQGFVTQNGTR